MFRLAISVPARKKRTEAHPLYTGFKILCAPVCTNHGMRASCQEKEAEVIWPPWRRLHSEERGNWIWTENVVAGAVCLGALEHNADSENSRAGSVGCKDFEDQGFGRDWSGWNCRTACNSAFPILEDVSRFCASV